MIQMASVSQAQAGYIYRRTREWLKSAATVDI